MKPRELYILGDNESFTDWLVGNTNDDLRVVITRNNKTNEFSGNITDMESHISRNISHMAESLYENRSAVHNNY